MWILNVNVHMLTRAGRIPQGNTDRRIVHDTCHGDVERCSTSDDQTGHVWHHSSSLPVHHLTWLAGGIHHLLRCVRKAINVRYPGSPVADVAGYLKRCRSTVVGTLWIYDNTNAYGIKRHDWHIKCTILYGRIKFSLILSDIGLYPTNLQLVVQLSDIRMLDYMKYTVLVSDVDRVEHFRLTLRFSDDMSTA